MESTMSWIPAPCDEPVKISKWKVKKGSKVGKGAILCIYETKTTKGLKLKSLSVGTVADILENGTDEFQPTGTGLVKMQSCTHPTVMKDMCAECGADLRREEGIAGNRKEPVSASVAMVHNIPELIVSEEQALELGKADEDRLLKTRKLVLLVDLDQTLIHTTNDNIPANLKGVHHFQLRHGNMMTWYHTRLRPKTEEFLEKISKLYELHICTFGSRMYAHVITKFLDPEGKYFSHRILSRDECFNQNTKIANLKALFPCGDSMVCIIDDREDVWNYSPNLIHVKAYRFFQGTADINAPPGLGKQENDSEPLTHKVTISRSNSQDKQSDETNKKDGEKDVGDVVMKDIGEKQDIDQNKESKDSVKGTDMDMEDSAINEEDCSNKEVDDKNVSVNQEVKDDKKSTGSHQMNMDVGKEVKGTEIKPENEESKGTEVKLDNEEEIDAQVSFEDKGEILNKNNEAKQITDPKKEVQIRCASGDKDDQNEDSSKCSTEKNDINRSEFKTAETKVVDDKNNEKKNVEEEGEVELEWDDEDDYLLHLEDILTRIHLAFYEMKDQMKSKEETADMPSLKDIIPYVKRKVLKGVNVVFSGVFPTNVTLEKSRAYILAKALGANVQANFVPATRDGDKKDSTTHLVAARLGTIKVRTAQKHKYVKVVNPNWLWVCAERLERVDERLYPLNEETSGSAFCESPDIMNLPGRGQKRKSDDDEEAVYDRTTGKRIRANKSPCTKSPGAESVSVQVGDVSLPESKQQKDGTSSDDVKNIDSKDKSTNSKAASITTQRFSTSYNPLMAFSDDDIACMDKEVEDIMDEEGEDSEEEDIDRDARIRSKVLSSADDDESVSDDSLSGDFPHGWNIKKKRKSLSNDSASDKDIPSEHRPGDEESENELDKYEKTVAAFAPDTESDSRDSFAESIGSVDDEMAEAVEREFLSHL